jgi:two-component system LytT family response regulator
MNIRTVIVDDEPGARQRLRRLLSAHSDVELVAECEDGDTAVQAVARLKPDLLLLDVQMPTLTGFEVLERLKDEAMPLVVFATAFDNYAVEAFDASATDYLLKPFGAPRFERMLDRVREKLRDGVAEERGPAIEALLKEVRASRSEVRRLVSERVSRPSRMVIRNGNRMPVVRYADVEYIEADGNYLLLHTGTATHRFRGTLQALLKEMDPSQFARIHRGTVANLDRVLEVQPWFSGDFVLVMQSGAKLRLSRTYNEVLDLIGSR